MQNIKPNIEPLFSTRERDSKLERSGRKEVWLTSIVQIIVFLVFLWWNGIPGQKQVFCVVNLVVMGIVFYIWDIILIIRRLHDINADNTFVIIAAIPFFTSFVLFVLGFIPSDPVDNKWGRYTIWSVKEGYITSFEGICDIIKIMLYMIVALVVFIFMVSIFCACLIELM